MDKHQKIVLTYSTPIFHFYTPLEKKKRWNTSEVFLTFSGSIERILALENKLILAF